MQDLFSSESDRWEDWYVKFWWCYSMWGIASLNYASYISNVCTSSPLSQHLHLHMPLLLLWSHRLLIALHTKLEIAKVFLFWLKVCARLRVKITYCHLSGPRKILRNKSVRRRQFLHSGNSGIVPMDGRRVKECPAVIIEADCGGI